MNRKTYIQETERINRKFEVKYFPKVKAAIAADVADVIEQTGKNGIKAGIKAAEAITSSGVTPVVQDLYNEVGLQFARRQWRQLQAQKRMAVKGFGFNAKWVQYIKNHLYKFLIDKITFQVAKTTRDVLLNVLNKAYNEGQGIEETVRQLKDLPLTRTQAARIVRTETTRASNTGIMAAAETFDYEQTKEWMSAHDKRVRGLKPSDHASHIGLDGQVIDYQDYFTDPKNGDQLMHPGDPNATAASTINCRCVVAVEAKVGADGRLIPKRKFTTVVYPDRRKPLPTVTI